MKSFGLKNFSAVKRFQDGTGNKDALYKTIKRKISGSRVRGSIVFFIKPGIRSRMMMMIIRDDRHHLGIRGSRMIIVRFCKKKRPRSCTLAQRTGVTKLSRRFSTQILKFLKIKKSPRSCTSGACQAHLLIAHDEWQNFFWVRDVLNPYRFLLTKDASHLEIGR